MHLDEERDERDDGLDDYDFDRLSDMEDSRPIYVSVEQPEAEERDLAA